MQLTLELDPNSINNALIVSFFTKMMTDIPDLNITVVGDVYVPGTWLEFGDPTAAAESYYAGNLNNPHSKWQALEGTGQYQWLVNDHRAS